MTNRMDYGALQWALHDLVDGLRPRLPAGVATDVREYIDHNELGLAIGDLVDVLLLERITVTPEEHEKMRVLLNHFREAGARSPVMAEMGPILDALDRSDRPGHRRGLPPLRGGHSAGDRRPGATEFPPDWDTAQIHASAGHVHGAPVELANGRLWREGEVGGVRLGILDAVDGQRRAVVPLPGPGVVRTPVATTPLRQRLASGIWAAGASTLNDMHALLDRTESQCLEALLDTGEWEEFADAVAARLATLRGESAGTVAPRARAMLLGFDLPVDGCDYLNDREAVLARLEAT